VHRRPSDGLDAAIRRAFALLDLPRQEAFLLVDSRHATERFEGVFLMAAINRLERYLHVAEELTDSEAMRVWVEDVLAEESAARDRARRQRSFASLPRRKARARAGARFEAIASEVMAELQTALAETDAPLAEESWRCVARTRQGTRCENPANASGLCELHAALVEDSALMSAPLSDEPADTDGEAPGEATRSRAAIN
jgi:hypothetical protein